MGDEFSNKANAPDVRRASDLTLRRVVYASVLGLVRMDGELQKHRIQQMRGFDPAHRC